MALIKCAECGNQVSDLATSCPQCGAPKSTRPVTQPKSSSPVQVLLGIVTAAGLLIWWIGSNNDKAKADAPPVAVAAPSPAPAAPAPAKEPACANDDLQCLGDKGVIAAGVYCEDQVERLAKHSVKWTDRMFEFKFSRFRWANKEAGEITYVGDKAQFQNGFGAFTPVVYECDMAADNKTVLDVRVSEGRLPAR